MTTAYATIDDLLALFETKPTKVPRLARLESLLEIATDEMIDELGGVDFNRNPTAGSRSWYVDTDGSNVVHVHEGLIALATLEFSFNQGSSFETIEPTEYRTTSGYLDPQAPRWGEPFFHLQMLPYGAWRYFPRGTGLVRLTGATGRSIPSPAREGVVDRARQLAYADPSYEGVVAADPEYGQPAVTMRWPDVTWKFIQREKQRFMACEL